MFAIDVDGLTKSFNGKVVVDDFTLKVPKGQVYGFLGPNGSGKTTTIRMICGLLTPDRGAGRCLGFDVITEQAAIKARVGYMTQRFSLYEDMTVAENLAFVTRLYRLDRPQDRITAMIEELGLTRFRNQLAGTLSGGWKQRMALGACLIHEPELLLLDEPTAGVDPQARRYFWDKIHALASRGITVLVSTHYMDEAERCDSLVYLLFGRVLAHGGVEEVVGRLGLVTWTVRGPKLSDLIAPLMALEAVEQVAPFGSTLRVIGTDGGRLEAALAPFRASPEHDWQPGEVTMEDVFIHLMAERGEEAA